MFFAMFSFVYSFDMAKLEDSAFAPVAGGCCSKRRAQARRQRVGEGRWSERRVS